MSPIIGLRITTNKDLEAPKTEFGSTHSVWRDRDDERPVGTLRRDPLPQEADRLFPTVGADTPQGLREILAGQTELATGRIARVLAVPSTGAGS